MTPFFKNIFIYFGACCISLILIYMVTIPWHRFYDEWAPRITILEILIGVFIALSIFIFQYLREKELQHTRAKKRKYLLNVIRSNLKVMYYVANDLENPNDMKKNQIALIDITKFDQNLNNTKNMVVMLSNVLLDSQIRIDKLIMDITEIEEIRYLNVPNKNKKWKLIKKEIMKIDNKLGSYVG